MFGSWRIARILGIDLSIHWTFWLLPIWVVWTWDPSSMLPLWMHLLLVAMLFVCVVLHEFGHALTARNFGIGTRSITLSPLGGIAQLERMSNKPWEEFWIAIAGPAVNVVIALVLGAGIFAGYAVYAPIAESLVWQFLLYLMAMNIGLVVFNLIPAFPMDGGRVLRAILAGSLGMLEGTRIAVYVGTTLAVLMGFAGLFLVHNPLLFLIAVFIAMAGLQELRALEMEERMRHEPLRMTVCLWDSRHGGWVRREVTEDV